MGPPGGWVSLSLNSYLYRYNFGWLSLRKEELSLGCAGDRVAEGTYQLSAYGHGFWSSLSSAACIPTSPRR
jgi:hypothetical protein